MIGDKLSKIKDLITRRSSSYKMTFGQDNAWSKAVLLDLAKFCRAHETTFDTDPRRHAVMEGRREVWLRIQRHLHLSEQELMNLHSIKYLPKGE